MGLLVGAMLTQWEVITSQHRPSGGYNLLTCHTFSSMLLFTYQLQAEIHHILRYALLLQPRIGRFNDVLTMKVSNTQSLVYAIIDALRVTL